MNDIQEIKDYLETGEVEEDELYSLILERLRKQDEIIIQLQEQLMYNNTKPGRKSEVLDLLKKHTSISIIDIAKKLNISTKNVSSQLTYLRSDGYKIFTDNNGRKILIDK